MDGKRRQRWLAAGAGAVLVGLIMACAVGRAVEAVILLATVAVCALSLIPLVVDRRTLLRLGGRSRSDRNRIRGSGCGRRQRA